MGRLTRRGKIAQKPDLLQLGSEANTTEDETDTSDSSDDDQQSVDSEEEALCGLWHTHTLIYNSASLKSASEAVFCIFFVVTSSPPTTSTTTTGTLPTTDTTGGSPQPMDVEEVHFLLF